jgi:uncharacterized membrane protein
MENRTMTSPRRAARYPKVRIDALTDGIFAVAMTLLVLDLRLSDDFHPTDSAPLLAEILKLWPKLVAYAFSFLLLGMRWLSFAQMPTRAEYFEGAYIRWWLFYLLLITCVSFTAIAVGRYASYAPAIWLYCANTALLAVASWRMAVLTPEVIHRRHVVRHQWSMAVLLASALLCFGWSFVQPAHALWAFVLNFAAPWLDRLTATRDDEHHPDAEGAAALGSAASERRG